MTPRIPLAEQVFRAALKVAKLPQPLSEITFHPTRKWRFDYAYVEEKVAVEQEGGLFGKGKRCPVCGRAPVAGHSSIARLKADLEKYSEAAAIGWRIIRVTPQQLPLPTTMTLIRRALGR